MFGLTSFLTLAIGLLTLACFLGSVALTKALQSYSRSRLEVYGESRGRADLAVEVGHLDDRTELGAEAVSVLSGLLYAILLGSVASSVSSTPGLVALLVLALTVGAAGYLLAAVAGRVFAESIVYACWPVSFLLRGASWPLIQAAAASERLVHRYSGTAANAPRPASVEVEIETEKGETPEDVEAELPDVARDLVQHVVELSRADVSQVMVPAPSIIRLPATISARMAVETFRRTGRSRIPIYGAHSDDILGILIGRDLWAQMIDADDPDAVVPAQLMRPAFFIPETRNALQLIDDLRRQRTQMAIVLNEYGAVAGLVTLEDLLERLVGLIDDEHDIPSPADPIRPLGGTRFEVEASLPLSVLNDRFRLHLPTDEDFQTVGGLAFHALGRLPDEGAAFLRDGIEFTILDVREHSIRRIMIDLDPIHSAAK